MDQSIIPSDFNYASPTQMKFIKNASIREICDTYNRYRSYKDNARMKETIKSTHDLLAHLESKGFVYSFIDPATSWLCFDVLPATTIAPASGVTNITIERTSSAPIILKSDKDVNISSEPITISREIVTSVPEFSVSNINVQTEEEIFADSDFTIELRVTNPLLWKLKVATKYTNTIKSAVKRNLDFNLDIDDIEALISQRRCFYTGVEFDSTHLQTFDRVDRKLGYVKGNVVACTTQANDLKNKLFEMSNGVFTDIASLKRFVDIMYIGISKEKDTLADLLLFK